MLAQHGPVHRLVAEDAGRRACKFALVEEGHRAEVGAYRAALQPGGESQHVILVLQRFGRERVVRAGLDGVPPSLRTVCASTSAWAL